MVGELLPGSLLEAFSRLADPTERVVAVLRWLAPLSTGSAAAATR
jgi:hypothetical protein